MDISEAIESQPFQSLFLGPKAENKALIKKEINSILDFWFDWRYEYFSDDPSPFPNEFRSNPEYCQQSQKLSESLRFLNELFKKETPTFTPRYLGHMVSDLLLPAILGHFTAVLHNPNNTSKEVSKVGAVLEKEGVAMLAEMIGYDSSTACGHFTSGGTVANFESLWRARFRYDHWLSLGLYLAEERQQKLDIFTACHMGWQRYHQLVQDFEIKENHLKAYSSVLGNPYKVSRLISKHTQNSYDGPIVLVPGNMHFSWKKAANIFGLGEQSLWIVPVDQLGKTSYQQLAGLIRKAQSSNRPILQIVSVAGTTETGAIDPIDKVQEVLSGFSRQDGLDIWHHIDAAYGGFACSLLHQEKKLKLDAQIENSLKAMANANSITLDPHKFGYVPYSCGAFLTKDQLTYTVSSFIAPYLERPELGDNKWSSTIEGSRSATGAAATWLVGKSVGFCSSIFSNIIQSTFEACQEFKYTALEKLSWLRVLEPNDTNILCFSVAEVGDSLLESNRKTETMFHSIASSPSFSCSKTSLAYSTHDQQIQTHIKKHGGNCNHDHLVLIRCVFMNPFWAAANTREILFSELITILESIYKKI